MHSNGLLGASQIDLATKFGHCAVLQAITLTLICIVVETYETTERPTTRIASCSEYVGCDRKTSDAHCF